MVENNVKIYIAWSQLTLWDRAEIYNGLKNTVFFYLILILWSVFIRIFFIINIHQGTESQKTKNRNFRQYFSILKRILIFMIIVKFSTARRHAGVFGVDEKQRV